MSRRADLQHLTPEALAHAANMGVVKRAVREMEGGYAPICSLDEHDTLTAVFSDGIKTVWAEGKPIQQALCNCGAVTVCRHRIIAALAYRAQAENESEAALPTLGSPGLASDEELAALLAPSLLKDAQEQAVRGISIEVRGRSSGEACDTARLPSATVRFWAGAAIGAARCDCVRVSACEHVALAVWAFRQADAEQADAAAAQVRLGQAGNAIALEREPYVNLIAALARHGVGLGAAPLAQPLSAAIEAARKTKACWLEHLLADLEDWSQSYAARSANYDAETGAALAAELGLRLAAGVLPGNAQGVLGIGAPGATELDRLRLVCLGARTLRDGELRRTRLILADIDTGTRLVLVKEWQVPQERFAEEATIRASERLAPGLRLEQLAQGQLLAQQAKRHADGSLTLAKARSSQNSVLPQAADWGVLGVPLRHDSVAALVEEKRSHPTAQIRPRHATGQFVVFSPAAVEWIGYDPNAQSLLALLADAEGRHVMVRRHFENHVRHALDVLAGVFNGNFGPLRHVGGILHWEHGMAVLEPWAVACDNVIVPDFAEACGALPDIALCNLPGQASDPLTRQLQAARRHCATLLHHGLKHLPRTWFDDVADTAKGLGNVGLHALARGMGEVGVSGKRAQAEGNAESLASILLDFLALLQLHADAQVVCGLQAESDSQAA
jgi:hypothetical protein